MYGVLLMFEGETARLAELIPAGIEPQSLPFTDVGDLFNFIGIMVVGGFITLWVLQKIVLCIYHSWRHKD